MNNICHIPDLVDAFSYVKRLVEPVFIANLTSQIVLYYSLFKSHYLKPILTVSQFTH